MMWPTWMDDAGLMAKSADKLRKGTGEQQTLSEHTYQVLQRLSDQVRLRPSLPELAGDPYLWDRLYWGCLLHDFGKAAAEFQARLANPKLDNRWAHGRHRHEVLSLGFVDWLYPRQPEHPDRQHVIAVIACHHKDAGYEREGILTHYLAHKPRRDLDEYEREDSAALMAYLAGQISPAVRQHLWRWLAECGTAWAEELNIPLTRLPTLVEWEAAAATKLEDTIYKALRDFQRWSIQLSPEDRTRIHLYRGLILTSDHAASGGASAFPNLRLTQDEALRPLVKRGNRTMPHQEKAAAAAGSAVLVAPTGAGKTEAALLWAARQIALRPSSRLFYTLPYQASMNAAAKRLSEEFFGQPFNEHQQIVTLKHSRATLRFYQDRMNIEEDEKAALRVAKERANKTGLNYFPVQVFSPYQMLKAAFALKGYETFLVDYADGLFIFDEIHAYHPVRMGLIIPFMRWLAQHYRARFLIMTATLPPMLIELLNKALPGLQRIDADEQTFINSRRHIVVFREGVITECLDEIVSAHQQGKSVLVCCNTVQKAQEMYDLLAHYIPKWLPGESADSGDLCLLHGRFHLKDRTAKENWLFQRVGVGEHRGEVRRATVMVATQVVEVSLNVDFDTLYTEPAPLEAMLQRFGRVNRGRGAGAPRCAVHVCRAPVGETESLPYDHHLVARALEVLPEGEIDEQQVSALLAQIYTGTLRDEWLRDYQTAAVWFEGIILGEMKPFESANDERERLFYKNFDGHQVLPADCAADYEAAFGVGKRLAASEYLVNVTNGQFWALKPRLYDEERRDRVWVVSAPYDSEYGLRFEVGEDDV